VRGYTFWVKSGHAPRRTSKPPVVHTDLPTIDGAVALSFLELMELQIVKAFVVDKSVPLQRVRLAAQHIAETFKTAHPFAHRRVYTDREQIFVGLSDAGIPDLLQVTGRRTAGQLVAGAILDRYVEEIDFAEDTALAERWFPLGRDAPIVLDPQIAFGAPTVTGTRIRTDVLALYATGNPVPSVARAFELKLTQVQAAIDFETQLARAA
jgi:uncharacterized protein (DUF433 family)